MTSQNKRMTNEEIRSEALRRCREHQAPLVESKPISEEERQRILDALAERRSWRDQIILTPELEVVSTVCHDCLDWAIGEARRV